MTYPMKQEIEEALSKIDTESGIEPTDVEHDAAQRVLLDLIQTHGFSAEDAYTIIRTIYWRGWNEGWSRGYGSRPRVDQVQTSL